VNAKCNTLSRDRQTSELMTLVAGERRSLFVDERRQHVYDKKPQCYAE